MNTMFWFSANTMVQPSNVTSIATMKRLPFYNSCKLMGQKTWYSVGGDGVYMQCEQQYTNVVYHVIFKDSWLHSWGVPWMLLGLQAHACKFFTCYYNSLKKLAHFFFIFWGIKGLRSRITTFALVQSILMWCKILLCIFSFC
jgi:hypothetical protein